jgi:predicted DsbA family dithiol-disulfide isomerase
MRDRLLAHPQTITDTASHAGAVGLDMARLDACLASGKAAAEIRKDMALAQEAGVQGTPSFFLAFQDGATGKLKPVKFLTGAQPFGAFKSQIDALLADDPK